MSKSFLKNILLIIFIAVNNLAFAQNDLKAHIEFGNAETAFQDGNYRTALKHIIENEKLLGIYSGKVGFLKIQILEELADFRNLEDTYLADLTEEIRKYMSYADKNPSKVPMEKRTTVYYLEQRIIENRADLEQERIAKEQKLAEEKRRKEEAEVKSYANAMRGDVSAMRQFLKDYPNHQEKQSVLTLLETKDDEAYNKALTKNEIQIYERYLSEFYDGKHKKIIGEQLAKAKEIEAYEQVLRSKSVDESETYLLSYQNGANKAEVLTVYEQALTKEGKQAMLAKDYVGAKSLYEKYLSQFPTGSSINKVETNYNDAKRKIKKAEILASREDVAYFMVDYGLNGSVGLEFGKVNNSYKPSVYGVMSYGFKVPVEDFGVVVEDYKGEDPLKVDFLSYSLGLTMKITYPLWIYAGANVTLFMANDHTDDEILFYPEFGLKTLIGKKLVLKAGTQILKNKNIYQFGLGIGF